jgi:steroid delta-isomerase-like uncharacterized protein
MDHVKTLRGAYERLNAGNHSGFADLIAENFIEHEEIPGIPPTKAGVLEYFRMLTSAFPDLQMTVDDIIASGDKAVARVTFSGTHKGAFMGVPPTHKQVQMKLIDIMQFDGSGLVSAHWGIADMMSLMQQLGVVPAEPPA